MLRDLFDIPEQPYYDDAQYDIQEFCDAVRATLQFWLDIHCDAETWAWDYVGSFTDWTELMRFEEEHGRVFSNQLSGYSFDLENAALYEMAKDWGRCTICDKLWHTDEGGCPDCEEGELTFCGYEDTMQWLEDLRVEPDEWLIRRIIIEQAFPEYRRHIVVVTGGIEAEVTEHIEAIDGAHDHVSLLSAVVASLGVYHYNGYLVRDYGEKFGLDRGQLWIIRDDGPEGWFDREDLREWLWDGAKRPAMCT